MTLSTLGVVTLTLLAQAEGVVVERTVQSVSIDPLGRRREVRREEVIRIRGKDVVIEDLTFGERLIIRRGTRKVWRADVLAGEYSELSFDEVAAHRERVIRELRAASARVGGTRAGEEIGEVLEGLDQFPAVPKVEVESEGASRRVIVNGDRMRLSVEVDPKLDAPGYLQALAAIGAFPPVVTAKLGALGGFPVKGTLRYVLFLDRVIDRFEVTGSRREAVEDAVFVLPDGLTRVPWRGLEPPPERNPAKPEQFQKAFAEDDLDRKKDPLRRK